MQIPVLFITILFIIFLFNLFANYYDQKNKKKIDEFLESCEKNNIVPSSKLNEINLIKINFNFKNFRIHSKDKETINLYKKLVALSNEKMTNFKDLSNDYLKATYGANNFKEVLSYQENFDNFLNLIVSLGEKLCDEKNYKSAISILELGINLESDLTKNYTLLAYAYDNLKMKKELFNLMDIVLANKNISQNKIINFISTLKKK